MTGSGVGRSCWRACPSPRPPGGSTSCAAWAPGVSWSWVPRSGPATCPTPNTPSGSTWTSERPTPWTSSASSNASPPIRPRELTEALDRFDPQGDALVLTAPFQAVTAIAGEAGGRVAAGRSGWRSRTRRPTTRCSTAPASTVRHARSWPPTTAAPSAPPRRGWTEDRAPSGRGTPSEGFNGGGAFVRWVTDEAQADGAQRWFAGRCRSVRVAPFLEGTPCNIHGFATDDGAGGVPTRGGDHAAVGGSARRCTTGEPPPSSIRPRPTGRGCGSWRGGWARCCGTRWDSSAATRSTGCSPTTASGRPS